MSIPISSLLKHVVDEISLEGLDGITLFSLWKRLEVIKEVGRLTEDVQQYVWIYLYQNDNFTFFQLLEDRPDVSVDEEIEEATTSEDVYPVHVIKSSCEFGSSATYESRQDVTATIRSNSAMRMLDELLDRHGRRFIVVASLTLRARALSCPEMSSTAFLEQFSQNKSINGALAYAVLERIGRSRRNGMVRAGVPGSICNVFGVKPKDVCYLLDTLQQIDLVYIEKHYFAAKVSVLTSAIYLKRFSQISSESSVERLIQFIRQQPNHEVPMVVLRKYCESVDEFPAWKRIRKWPIFVKQARDVTQGEYEALLAALATDGVAFGDIDQQEDEDVGDSSKTEPPTAMDVASSEPALTKSGYIRRISFYGLRQNADSWRLTDSESAKVSVSATPTISWEAYDPFENPAAAMLRAVNAAGEAGCSIAQLQVVCRNSNKRLGKDLERDVFGRHLKTVRDSHGKQICTKYISLRCTHPMEEQLKRFEELSSGMQLNLKEDSWLSHRSVLRLNFLLSRLHEARAMMTFSILRAIQRWEQNERGESQEIDKNSLARLINYLLSKRLVTVCTKLVNSPWWKVPRKVEIVGEPDLDIDAWLTNTDNVSRLLFHDQSTVAGRMVRKMADGGDLDSKDQEIAEVEFKVTSEASADHSPAQPPPSTFRLRTKKKKQKSHTATVNPAIRPPLFTELRQRVKATMTYDKGASLQYGIQQKMTRAELLHEFLVYWLLNYRGSGPSFDAKFRLEKTLGLCLMPVTEEGNDEPHVYCNEMGWRRYVPPPAQHDALPSGWFVLNDLLLALPLSIFVQLFALRFKIAGLDEWLDDPMKRHFVLADLPLLLRNALVLDNAVVFATLRRNVSVLVAMRFLTCGPQLVETRSPTNKLSTFYLHTAASVLDTSTAPCCYMAVPPAAYEEYTYDFIGDDDAVGLHWCHVRAVCLSTRLGHRTQRHLDGEVPTLCKDATGKPASDYRTTLETLGVQTPVMFDAQITSPRVDGPRNGAGGFHPLLFTDQVSAWKLNTSPLIDWYVAEVQAKCARHEGEVSRRVKDLTSTWNSYLRNTIPAKFEGKRYESQTREFDMEALTKKRPGVSKTQAASRRSRDTTVAGAVLKDSQASEPSSGSATPDVTKGKRNQVSRKRTADAVDLAAKELMHNIRASYTPREREMLLTMKALAAFLYPIKKLWMDASVLRDLMHKHCPESKNKTTQMLNAAANRDVLRNEESQARMNQMMQSMGQCQELVDFRTANPVSLSDSEERKRSVFCAAFDLVRRCVFAGTLEDSIPDTYEEFRREFVVQLKKTGSSDGGGVWKHTDPDTVITIRRSVLHNFVHASYALSRRDGPFAAHFFEIYRQFADSSLLSVLDQMRRGGILSYIRTDMARRTMATNTQSAPPAGGSQRDYVLSFYYRHFFYHKFCTQVASEAQDLVKILLKAVNDNDNEWTDIMQEVPGYASVVASLMCMDQIEFDINFPDDFFVIGDDGGDESQPSEEGAPPSNSDLWSDADHVSPIGVTERATAATEINAEISDGGAMDHPPIAEESALALHLSSEEDEPQQETQGDEQGESMLENKNTENKQPQQQPTSMSKVYLMRMRRELLRAQGGNSQLLNATAAASIPDTRTQPSISFTNIAAGQIRARLRTGEASLCDALYPDTTVVRTALDGLLTEWPAEDQMRVLDLDAWLAQQQSLDDAQRRAVVTCHNQINVAGAIGLLADEHKQWAWCFQLLIAGGFVLRVGVRRWRYVAVEHAKDWFVDSFRVHRDFKASQQQRTESPPPSKRARPQNNGEQPVCFQPRPWLRPDGTLNKPMLRWLCEGVFLRILANPGMSEERLLDSFDPALQPCRTAELLEFMTQLGCITRLTVPCRLKQLTLFNSIDVSDDVVYQATTDAVNRLGVAFDRTPMPDFIANPIYSNARGSCFGRYR